MTHMANSIAEYQRLVPNLINQVQQLQSVIQDLKSTSTYITLPTHISSNASISTLSTSITNPSGTATHIFKAPFNEYCHTHGLCAHNGYNCKDPVKGKHKKEATFYNRMNGSDRNCHRARKIKSK